MLYLNILTRDFIANFIETRTSFGYGGDGGAGLDAGGGCTDVIVWL